MNKRSKVAGVVVAVLGLAVAIGLPTASWLSGQRDASAAITAEPARTVGEVARHEAPAPKAEPTIYLAEVVISEKAPVRKAAPAPKPRRACQPSSTVQPLLQEGAPGARTVRVTTFCD